jgi:DNA-binding XRE family transcriptional regulator
MPDPSGPGAGGSGSASSPEVAAVFFGLPAGLASSSSSSSATVVLSRDTIIAIELGHSSSKGVTLRWYFKYASYLGVPLSHIFINAVERKEEDLRIRTMPGKYFLTSEDFVMERVQEAARQLEKSGQYITI